MGPKRETENMLPYCYGTVADSRIRLGGPTQLIQMWLKSKQIIDKGCHDSPAPSVPAVSKKGTPRIPTKDIALGLTFVGLNIIDAHVSAVALALGGIELNPIAATGFGNSVLLKGLAATVIATVLFLFKRSNLLKWLDLGMLLIVVWNGFALWLC
jgi:hypothetical protein